MWTVTKADGYQALRFRQLVSTLAFLLLGAQTAFPGSTTAEKNYVLHCSGCHGMQGRGSISGRIPDFVDSLSKIASTPDGVAYIAMVPGVKNAGLSAADTADVLNYVLDRFGGAMPVPVRFDQSRIQSIWSLPTTDITVLRNKICQSTSGPSCAAYPWQGKQKEQ